MTTKQLLTRTGARELTETIDRVATAVQNNPELLGIESKIALDFARRCDLISDAVETTASTNFPLEAKQAGDEKAESVEPDGEGFDATQIGEEVPGPDEQIDADEPFMKGHFTQTELHQLGDMEEAGNLGKLAALFDDLDKRLAAMPTIVVPAMAGFTDHARELDAIATEVQELNAQIEALVGPLLARKDALNKEQKKIHEAIKNSYKDSLTEVGNVVIRRKTKLVEANAKLQVVAKRRTEKMVDAELMSMVAEKYDQETANFIKTARETLRDQKKTLSISFKGFELEQRMAKTASVDKEAGLLALVTKFQEMIQKGWKRMVALAKNGLKMIMGADKKVEKAHDEFMKVLDSQLKLASVETPAAEGTEEAKTASEDNFAGFNLLG